MNVCLYFQIHQPFRLRRYHVFDIGKSHEYFDDKLNRQVMEKVAKKCYLPATRVLIDLLRKHKDMKVAFSITSTALEQMERYAPGVISMIKQLAKTGRVEFLSETSHHSLAFLYDKKEFKQQVLQHKKKMKQMFGVAPTVFRNTELIYSTALAKTAESMGFKGILAEGADQLLGDRSPNYVYKPKGSKIKLLLKNYKLSDDIAFRFSDPSWAGWPLTARKFAKNVVAQKGEMINLFMDYETFGEHQWKTTGIFTFLRQLPAELKKKGIGFHLPSEAAKLEAKVALDVKGVISWADAERDMSAWLGNKMQVAAVKHLYELLPIVMKSKDKDLIELWRKLSASDHVYYMSTKFFEDGEVHQYFSPYESPYDGFIAFMNILNDLQGRLENNNGMLEVIE